MKNWKSPPLLVLALITIICFAISCGEDRSVEENVAYVVEVEIITPANNTTLTTGENFNVEVDYTRKDNTIHNIKVEILDAAGNQVMKLVEQHAHVANEFTFKSENISISEAGTYTLRASTTDLHTEGDGNEPSNGDGHEEANLVEHKIIIQ